MTSSGYYLLTGATGLLGRYLLRDMLAAGLPVAVLVRSAVNVPARARIEGILARFEADAGYALPRPVVLEGDLHQPRLGLSDRDQAWAAEHCSAVLNSAASITFYGGADDEPWRTNVAGTGTLIDFCREAGIREFHHTSTAYVCGHRRGLVLESELDVGQQLGNDYERSKVASERLVREADCFDTVTVYRPSIIVGDSQTAYTSTFHGFYTPLRLAYAQARAGKPSKIMYLDVLGLDGSEGKNFVPVDWVSAVMTHLLVRREHHGRAYHLTNPTNSSANSMVAACTEAIVAATKVDHTADPEIPSVDGENETFFRRHMDVYRSYLRDDARFDASNTLSAAPLLPCPPVDHALMARLAAWAIESNFGWPREATITPRTNVDDLLHRLEGRTSTAPRETLMAVVVDGPGGGARRIGTAWDGRRRVVRGLKDDAATVYYLNAQTLEDLVRGRVSAAQAVRTGRVLIEQDGGVGDVDVRALGTLASELADVEAEPPAAVLSEAPCLMGGAAP